jgi:hypothetical protein
VQKDGGKPGEITVQDEVFSISVFKGPGQGEVSRLSAPSSIRSLSRNQRQAGARLKWTPEGAGAIRRPFCERFQHFRAKVLETKGGAEEDVLGLQ